MNSRIRMILQGSIPFLLFGMTVWMILVWTAGTLSPAGDSDSTVAGAGDVQGLDSQKATAAATRTEASVEASVKPSPVSTPAPTPKPTPAPIPVRITLAAIGDILLHQTVIDGGLQPDGSYQYDHAFADTRDLLSAADFTLANYEGTLNGPPYTGYPMFGGPDEIAIAMREAGIDLAVTANNHAFDRRLSGLVRTPKVFADAGIATVGTRSSEADPTYVIEEIGGIRVGFTAWTWETIGTDTQRAINGIPLPKEAEPLIDSFNASRPTRYAQDLDAMKLRLTSMREAGAECLVFIPHWGEEYVTTSNRRQRDMARFLSDTGVDVIFGMHPHVLQEAETIHSEASGKDTLVFYSLGGFLSNMDYGTHGTNGNALDALIAMAVIERAVDGTVRVVEGGYSGTTIVREKEGLRTRHRVLPVAQALVDLEAFSATSHFKALEAARLRLEKVLAGSTVSMEMADSILPFGPAYGMIGVAE